MHRRRRQHPARHPHAQPSRLHGLKLSAATFVAGITAALVMIGANADEPGTPAAQGIGSAHVALSIGR